MPNIPSKSLVTTPRGAGMVHQDGLNNAQPYNNEGYNTFDRSNVHQITQRFADIRPYNCQIPVDGDVIRNRNVFDLSTYTMKSRLLTRVRQHLSAFSVPLSAIMPYNWDKVVQQPSRGSDLPDNAYPYWNLTTFLSTLYTQLTSTGFAAMDPIEAAYLVIALSGMLGHDSLLKYLGYSSPIADEVDDLYSSLVDEIVTKPYAIEYEDADSNTYILSTTAGLSSVMDLLERVWRGEFTLKNFRYNGNIITAWTAVSESALLAQISAILAADGTATRTVLMLPVFAYQMTCAQFFVNSHIDNICTGRDWLNNLRAFASSNWSTGFTFTLNGVTRFYDLCSSAMFSLIISTGITLGGSTWFKFVSNIFALRNSLRVPDYFVDSRLEPLAPGNFDVAVNNNAVSVIEVNAKMWLQRLANAVNRSNDEINQYLYNMTGIQRQRIEPQPVPIVSETFDVHQQETENTGQAQVSDADAVTSRLSRTESKYMFEIMVDEPETVVIWLQSFSAQYTYPNAIDKHFDLQDRFDIFNSFMQHVGDQEVKTHELDALVPYGQKFGHQLRYAQYKNSISIACGGFSRGVLDTWALMWPKYQNGSAGNTVVVSDRLDSSFIRNHNGDFDKFYQSLTGKDPASRFHFICQFYNITANNSKQQAYPTLL